MLSVRVAAVGEAGVEQVLTKEGKVLDASSLAVRAARALVICSSVAV